MNVGKETRLLTGHWTEQTNKDEVAPLRRAAHSGWAEESSPLGWRFRVDAVAHPVDHDVMVEPAQGGEIGGVVVAAVGSPSYVVGLEPVVARAAVGGAGSAVSVQHEPAYRRWDRPGRLG